MIIQELDLNMVPGSVPPVINVSQFDTGSRTLVFTLYNGANLFTGSVKSVRIEGLKPDNKGFSYNASYNNGVVTADCTEQMTIVKGDVLCELRLIDSSDNSLGTLNFILRVERSPINEDTDFSETEIPALIDLARSHAEASAASAAESAASASESANSARQSAVSAAASAASAAEAENIKIELQEHLDQIDTNKQNIAQLRADVDHNADDIRGLREDVDNDRADLDALTDYSYRKNAAQDGEINRLKDEVGTYTDEINQLREDVDVERADLDELTEYSHDKNDEQDEEIDKLKADLEDNTRRTDRVYDNVFRDSLGKLFAKQGFIRFKQGYLLVNGKVSVIDELREDVDSNKADIDGHTEDIAQLREDVNANKADIICLSDYAYKKNAAQDLEINSLKDKIGEIDELREDVDSNKADIDGHTEDIAQLREDVNANKADIICLSDYAYKKNAAQDLEINSLKDKIGEIDELREDVDANTAEIISLSDYVKTKNAEQDEEIDTLQFDLEDISYKTDRMYNNVFKDSTGKLYAKQGFLKFGQGRLLVTGKVSVIDELTADVVTLDEKISANATKIAALTNVVNINTSDISDLRSDVDTHTEQIQAINESLDEKLNRPEDNPPGDLNQLLASNGNGSNSNKWVNIDDLLRDSDFIKQIIALIDSDQGILTVQQGRLTFMQGRIKVRNIS